MNISWHLLFEQLQRNPELLEEDQDGDFVTLSSQVETLPVSEDKEAAAIQRLQQSLGNTGFQKLLLQREAVMASTTNGKQTPTPEAEIKSAVIPPDEISTQNISVISEIKDAEMTDKPKSVSSLGTTDQPSKANDEETPVSQQMSRSGESVKEDAKTSKATKKSDQAIRLNYLLQQFIAFLPAPTPRTWKFLGELFDYLPPIKQNDVVNILVKRVQSLPNAQQKIFVTMIQRLPRELGETAFVVALSAKLLGLMPKTPEIDVPETPEE